MATSDTTPAAEDGDALPSQPSEDSRREGPPREDHRDYWRANLRLMAWLLAIWFGVSFGLGILLVERLNAFALGGFPLGFWFAHQGSILVFVALVAVYVVAMDRIDHRYEVD